MSNCPECIHKIWHVTRQRALAHTVDIYIDPYVSQPIETVANEASTYIQYIFMCQSMLTRNGKKKYVNTVQFLAQTDRFVF